MSEVRIERLGIGDLDPLLAGYRTVFTHPLDPELAAWRYFRSPEGPAVLLGARDGDDLIGGYALLPRRYRWMDKQGLCYQRTDAWVMSTHRRLGIYNRLVETGMQAALDAGASFLFGFPNQHPGAAQNKRGVVFEVPLRRRIALLRARPVPGIRGWVFRLAAAARKAKSRKSAPGFAVREVGAAELESRVTESEEPPKVTPVADAAYWKYKYLDPSAALVSVITVEHEGRPVLTTPIEWGKQGAYLLDLRPGPDPQTARTGLQLLLGYIAARGIAMVVYESSTSDHQALLSGARFMLHPRSGHTTVHPIANADVPLDPERWSFMLGDRDVVESP